jgi:hypothetical protein
MAPSRAMDWSNSDVQTEQFFNQVLRFSAAAWREDKYQCEGVDTIVSGQTQTWWKIPSDARPDLQASIEALSPTWKVKSPAEWNAAFYG